MFSKINLPSLSFKCRNTFCIIVAILGFILLGLGIYLITVDFALTVVSIGAVLSGVLLLVCGCAPNCLRHRPFICLLLVLVGLFLIITGILAIILVEELVIGLIVIGLGIISLLLGILCFCPCPQRRKKPCPQDKE
ncbi:MAG TPA: hypothetical protein VKY40_07000 [Halanaerobiales bacterium]|nr:hypothetical protein [Halanaerobiales bacterium]